MKIFLSWSGERSKAVALALREWLPLVLAEAKPFLSHTDIEPGERWSVEIAKELEASDFGIVCLTKENLTAPWILFEAGAVAKKMLEGAVVPYLLDLEYSELTGPLSQFQSKKANEESTLDIVRAIKSRLQSPVGRTVLQKRFKSRWPMLEKRLDSIPPSPAKASSPQDRLQRISESLIANLPDRERKKFDELRPNLEKQMHDEALKHAAGLGLVFDDDDSDELIDAVYFLYLNEGWPVKRKSVMGKRVLGFPLNDTIPPPRSKAARHSARSGGDRKPKRAGRTKGRH